MSWGNYKTPNKRPPEWQIQFERFLVLNKPLWILLAFILFFVILPIATYNSGSDIDPDLLCVTSRLCLGE